MAGRSLSSLSSLLPAILAKFRSFRGDQQGSLAASFALVMVPIFLVTGAAIDYSLTSRDRTKLNAIADVAALTAVNRTAMEMTPAAAQAAAQTMFTAQAASVAGATVSNVSVNVTTANLTRTALVSYTATRQTPFAAMFGMSSMAMGGTATATSNGSAYIDFYLLLDNTPSMGVGATTADITKMVNNTPDQCAFACHDTANSNNYYNLAKKLGVTMRIDVVRQATQQLTGTATSSAIYPNQFRMAVYTFGASASAANLTTIAPLTSDLASVKTATAGVDLMTVSGQNQNSDQDTNYDAIFPAIDKIIPNPGPGTAGSPQKILFFVSDGVADEQNANCLQKKSGTRCQEPIDPSLCAAMKNRGVLIAVLYTTYLPLPTNSWYNTWIQPFSTQIAPAMKACATPGLFFEVNPQDGIPEAMTTLFQKAITVARLSK
jgi:Flp pilus assembly protein TadG